MKENEPNLIVTIQCKKWHNTVCESTQEEAANSARLKGAKKGVKKTITKLEIYNQGFED